MKTRISKKVSERLASQVPHYQRVVRKLKDRAAIEEEVSSAVKNIFEHAFGWEMHSEILSQDPVKTKRCDITIKLQDDVLFLVEIKKANVSLNDNHLFQVNSYAVHKGVEWVILTNGDDWQIHKTTMKRKKLESKKVVELSFTGTNLSDPVDQEKAFFVLQRIYEKETT